MTLKEGGIFSRRLKASRSVERVKDNFFGGGLVVVLFVEVGLGHCGQTCGKFFCKRIDERALVGNHGIKIFNRQSKRAQELIIQSDASGIGEPRLRADDVKRVSIFGEFLEEKFHRVGHRGFKFFHPTRTFEHAFGQDDFCFAKVSRYAETIFNEQFVGFVGLQLLRKKFVEVCFMQHALGKRHPDLKRMRRLGKFVFGLKKVADVFGKARRN